MLCLQIHLCITYECLMSSQARRGEDIESPGSGVIGLQTTVSCPEDVGVKPGSFEKADSAFNHWAISLVPQKTFVFV